MRLHKPCMQKFIIALKRVLLSFVQTKKMKKGKKWKKEGREKRENDGSKVIIYYIRHAIYAKCGEIFGYIKL